MSTRDDSSETFAGCRIEAELGRGGMGVVYRATQLRLERPVALKVYAPSDPGQDPRHVGTIEPVWNLFDLTPQGRPDWDEQLSYQ